jgi:hypothetical protein
MKAAEFWEGKPHYFMSLPMSEIKKLLAGKTVSKSNDWELQKFDGMVEIEYVVLTPEEMEALDEEEKIGRSIGESIFICSNMPEEYLPMVLLNLYSLKHVNDNSSFSQMMKEAGVSIDISAHWSATLFDIAMAEGVFREQPGKFAEYLKWRKEVERTEFFQRIELDNLFHSTQQRRNYRLTTHPSKRGKYARRSWALTGALGQISSNLMEDFRSFSNTRADVVARRMVECPSFDPDAMVELINLLKKKTSSEVVEIPAGKLDNQAYLLTSDICGESYVLEQAGGHNLYRMARQGGSTLNALSDRIVFFYRQAALKKGVSADIFKLVKNAGVLELPTESGTVEIDIADPVKLAEGKKRIGGEMNLIDQKIGQIDQVLSEYQRLTERLNANSAVSLTPGSLESSMKEYVKAKEVLVVRKTLLEAALENIEAITKLKSESHSLLNAAILDFVPEPKQLLA